MPNKKLCILLLVTLVGWSVSAADTVEQSQNLKTLKKENATTSALPTESKMTLMETPFWMKRNLKEPELKEVMDRMLIREQMIKRNIQFPPLDVKGYSTVLSQRTTHLLNEAEQMLNQVTNVKERLWILEFIHRLKFLLSMLNKSAAAESDVENKKLNISTRGNIQSSGKTLGENTNLPSTSSTILSSIATDLTQDDTAQKSSKTSALPSIMTKRPKLSQDNDQERSVPLPQMRNKKDEDDELVRELENLHNIGNQPQNVIQEKNEQLKNVLIDEAGALQRLGGTTEEIRNSLQLDDSSLGYKDHNSRINQNPVSIQTDMNTFRNLNTEVKEVHSEESMISETNRHVWRPPTQVHPASHPSKDMYMNRSFQGMHMNLPLMNQQILSRQLQNGPKNLPHAALHMPHYNGIKNTIQKLQGPDYQFNNHIVHDPHTLQNAQHGIPAPMEVKQNHYLQNDGKSHFNPALGLYRPGPGSKHGYSPYPYFPSINQKNSTLYGTQIYPSYGMNNNFSDEMKRQLRDGKVILLSDSVVRSNFEQNPDKDKNDNGKTEAPDKIAESDGKNETQAQN